MGFTFITPSFASVSTSVDFYCSIGFCTGAVQCSFLFCFLVQLTRSLVSSSLVNIYWKLFLILDPWPQLWWRPEFLKILYFYNWPIFEFIASGSWVPEAWSRCCSNYRPESPGCHWWSWRGPWSHPMVSGADVTLSLSSQLYRHRASSQSNEHGNRTRIQIGTGKPGTGELQAYKPLNWILDSPCLFLSFGWKWNYRWCCNIPE